MTATTPSLPLLFSSPTMPPMSGDPDLAAWVKHRDSQAFQRVVERHVGAVAAMCRRQLGASQEADDAAQAVFVVLARRANGLRLDAPLAPWLFGVAQRVCQHARRAAARRHRHERAAAMAHMPHDHTTATDSGPGWEEARRHLDEAISALGAGQRMALMGHYLEGLPQAAVAQRLGISEEAIRKRLQAAREQLRLWYARRGVTVGAVVLLAGLVSEAPAAEPILASACVQAGLHPSGAAVALANGISVSGIGLTTGMTAWGLGVAAAVLVVTGALAAFFVGGSGPNPHPQPQANDVPVSLSEPALPEEQPGPVLARQLATKITAQYRRDHLSEVLADLNDQVGLDSAAPPSIRTSTMFSYEAQNVTVQSVLERLAHEQGLRITYRDNTVAVWKMADDQVIAALKKRILDPALGARLETVFDLGQLADPRIYGPLIVALGGTDRVVAGKVLQVLELHQGSVRCQTVVPIPIDSLIIRASKDSPGELLLGWTLERRRSQAILGYSRDARAIEWLIQAIGKIEPDSAVFFSGLFNSIGSTKSRMAIDILRARIEQRDPQSRFINVAARALGMIGDDLSASVLRTAILDRRVENGRSGLIVGLAQLRGPEVVKNILQLVREAKLKGVELQIVAEGLRRNSDSHIVDIFIQWLSEGEKNSERRKSAIVVLGHYRNPEVADQLWRLMNNPGTPELIGGIRQILSAQRDPRVVAPLLAMVEYGSLADRQEALENLANFRDPALTSIFLDNLETIEFANKSSGFVEMLINNERIREKVMALLEEPNSLVKVSAIGIMDWNTSPNSTEALIKLLNHKNPVVRSMAFFQLSVVRDPRLVMRLIEGAKDPLVGPRNQLFNWLSDQEDPRLEDAMLTLLEDQSLPHDMPILPYDSDSYNNTRIRNRLLELLKSSRSDVRNAVLGPLMNLNTPEIANAIVEIVQPSDWANYMSSYGQGVLQVFLKHHPELTESYEKALKLRLKPNFPDTQKELSEF